MFSFALRPSRGFRSSLEQMLRPGPDARFSPPNPIQPQKIRPRLLEANPHHDLYRHCSLLRHPNGPPPPSPPSDLPERVSQLPIYSYSSACSPSWDAHACSEQGRGHCESSSVEQTVRFACKANRHRSKAYPSYQDVLKSPCARHLLGTVV